MLEPNILELEDSSELQEKITHIMNIIKNKYKHYKHTTFTSEEKSQMRKKLLASKELYDSELAYIADMELWGNDFRKFILNMTCLSAKEKYMLNEHIFMNLGEIINAHKIFVQEANKVHFNLMKKHNDLKGVETDDKLKYANEFIIPLDEFVDCHDLEYASLDLNFFFRSFKSYVKYVERLPSAVYEFEKLMAENQTFKKCVEQWFFENKVDNLGPNHFFYRPSTKMTRYDMLYGAIIKHERNERNLELFNAAYAGLGHSLKILDATFKERSEFFKVYTFYTLVTYTKTQYGIYVLRLTQQNTEIKFNQQLIVKKTLVEPASYKQVILINNMLIICKTRQSDYDEIHVDAFPLFLSKYAISKKRIVFFDTADELTKYFPIYFVQKETLDIKGIYFTDKYSRNNAFELFKECLKKASPETNNTVVKLVKSNKITEEVNKITCALNISNTQNENDIKNMYDYKDNLNLEFDETEDDIKSVHTSLIEWNIENEYQTKSKCIEKQGVLF